MNRFSKKQIIITGIIALIIVGGFFFFAGKKPLDTKNTAVVTRGNIAQEVSVTGRVKAATTVDLGFEKSARIQGVYVKVGGHVNQGALLAEVESSVSQANLLEAQARLTELKNGPRPEELAVKESELSGYVQSLSNAYGGVLDTVSDAFNKADDALHSKISGIFSGYKTSSYKFTFSVCDSQLDTNVISLRQTNELDMDSWRAEQSALSATPSQSELSLTLDRTILHLSNIKSFLESVNRVLTLDCTVSNTTLDTYRTNVNLARANITTALSAVNTKKQSIASLVLTIQRVRDELTLLKAGQTAEAIAVQEARVLSAVGDLRKSKIFTPISGTVTKVDAVTGEFASVSAPLISIISDNSFEMEANVPEADIAKVKLNDSARITLDAYGSDVFFDGTVTAINPAETVIDNVPTYKVTFHFLKDDPRVKSGMTANIDIATDSRTNVVHIPARALITRDNQKYVAVMNADGTNTETQVTVGLRGSDGSIEILSGLSEGTRILITTTE